MVARESFCCDPGEERDVSMDLPRVGEACRVTISVPVRRGHDRQRVGGW